jgi:hypothetical protein
MIEMVIASFPGMEALDFVIVNQVVESIVGCAEDRNPDPSRLESILNLKKCYSDQFCAK